MILIHKSFSAEIELNESETAKAIERALPIEASAQVWQEEIYFEIPVAREQERGVETVKTGDVAYWPPGKAFCVFFGRTQPISAVTIIGRVKTNLEKFRKVQSGDRLLLDED